ncbi:helix-turn-helix domain-containing protein [Natrinema saccharevitans]|uniref:helix-turn-helix domain-containing protein n=1 Tax=Natrinema saccharevitans TaxID=301967 RepID=UPI001FE3933D|nr:helix-turn-helix domain-containing protein [Natrinema saccharevitans]
MNGRREIKPVHKLDEILAITKRLTEGTLTETTETVDLTKGTAHTYLRTLHNCGYLTEEDDVYRLSVQFVTVAEHVRTKPVCPWRATTRSTNSPNVPVNTSTSCEYERTGQPAERRAVSVGSPRTRYGDRRSHRGHPRNRTA